MPFVAWTAFTTRILTCTLRSRLCVHKAASTGLGRRKHPLGVGQPVTGTPLNMKHVPCIVLHTHSHDEGAGVQTVFTLFLASPMRAMQHNVAWLKAGSYRSCYVMVQVTTASGPHTETSGLRTETGRPHTGAIFLTVTGTINLLTLVLA